MALTAAERELLIKLGLVGQVETKAGLDSVKQSVEGVGLAGTKATTESEKLQELFAKIREAAKPAADATRDLGQSATQAGAGFASFSAALPALASVAVAVATFNRIAGELKQRGVDIETMGDKFSSAMDKLAIAGGGMSKTMSGMVSEVQKTQAAFTDLDAAQKAYGTGLALLEASQTATADGMKLFASVASEIPADLAAMGGGLENVGVRARVALASFEELNKELNVIRTTNPELADSYAKQLTALSALGLGTAKYNEELSKLKPGIAAATKESENWATVAKAAAGGSDEAAKGLARLTTETKLLSVELEKGRALHLSEEQVFTALSPLVQKTAQDYSAFGSILRVTAPALAAVGEAAANSKPGLDAAATALKAAQLAAQESEKSYRGLIDSITKAGAAHGDYRAALANEHAAVDSAITALEKQKATVKGLTVEEESRLKNLLAMHAALTPLTVEEEKHNKAQEAGVKAVHDLSKSYEDLTRAREKDKAAIQSHLEAAVAALDAELAKAIASGNQENEALSQQLANQEITQSQYNQRVNELFAAQADAKRKTIEAEDRLNEEAVNSEKEHQRAYEEAAGAIAKSMEERKQTLESAKLQQATYDVEVARSLSVVRGEWDATAGNVKTAAGAINLEIDGMVVKMTNLKNALGEVGAAAAAAFGEPGAFGGTGNEGLS